MRLLKAGNRAGGCGALGLLAAVMVLQAQPDLLQPENLQAMGCAAPDLRFHFAGSSQPGNLFHPGESVDLTLGVCSEEAGLESITLEVWEIQTREHRLLDRWNEARTERMTVVEPVGLRGRVVLPCGPVEAPDSTNLVELRQVPVPARFGTYVLTVAPNGERPQFLCTVGRVPRPRPGALSKAPILASGLYLTQDAPSPERIRERAHAVARLGIGRVQLDLTWSEPQPTHYDWRWSDALFGALEEARLEALVTLSGHPAWSLPFGEPTPAVNRDLPDHTCLPRYDPVFGRFVSEFCVRYRREGQGALWGLEHWNQPWDGLSLHGWQSDSRRYRALMQQLAGSARRVDPRIRTAAAGSIMNTELKFLTGDRPEDRMQQLDVFTDHHQPPRSNYGPMVARRWGKESIDTGLWIAGSECALVQVMCQALACGQDRVTPWHPSMAAFSVPGAPMRFQMPTPVAVATAAFNAQVSGRPFRRCLSRTRLPWAFQFGEGVEAVVVLMGRLLPPPDGDRRDLPWWQMELQSGGTITLDNADGRLEFLDVAGNPEFAGQSEVRIPGDTLGHYLRSPEGGVELIEQRLGEARIEGFRPVEIIARDFVSRLDGPAPFVRVTLHNLLNRSIAGVFSVELPATLTAETRSRPVSLGSGEFRDFQFAVRVVQVHPGNAYPCAFRFESDAGTAAWREVLHDLVIRRRAITVDGRLEEWARIPGVPLRGNLMEGDFSERLWQPFAAAQAERTNALMAELKLAWDDRHLYVAARVNDPSPSPGHVRLATWDQDQYFRGASDDAVCELLRPMLSLVRELPDDPTAWDRCAAHTNWTRFQRLISTNAAARAAVESGAARVYFRARERQPTATFADAAHVYRRAPWGDRPHAGDTLQIGLDVLAGVDHHGMVSDGDLVPEGLHAMPDTDYEFCAYACEDGGTEVWRALAPGVPRSHPVPRQERASRDQGAVPGALCVVSREGPTLTYELAIPWSALQPWSPVPGQRFGLMARVNDQSGPPITFGSVKSATKANSLSLHPYHESKPSCGVQWTLGPAK